MKYSSYIEALEDNQLYAAGTIPTVANPTKRRRMRIAFINIQKKAGFPAGGDGVLIIPGQGPLPGWFGWRWKAALLGVRKTISKKKPSKNTGMKYAQYIEALEDNRLYAAGTIPTVTNPIERRRMRIAFIHFRKSRGFPDRGDGFLTIPGQAPFPGWFGWRWKAALLLGRKKPSRELKSEKADNARKNGLPDSSNHGVSKA
ncbi:MAG: hypothetical protein QNK37_01145 [Acidobacteriota bacterium]|nr:hypothetical protein [Acidobacteriota bacterium]